jgi:CubicO group peptidase (beta-lactamase class C family)
MMRSIGILLVFIAQLLIVTQANAQTCPQEIRGGWEGVLPASELFETSLSVRVDGDADYSARLQTLSGEERVAVWRDGKNLRLQSSRLPLTFDGRLSSDSKMIDGFIAYASNLYRISLLADDATSWSASWNPLPVESDTVRLDLYFDDDGAGGTAGYFFFRDQRLPGLYGYGTRCSDRMVNVGEKNLGLTFEGEFDREFSQVEMTVTGPSGEAHMLFAPMQPERLEMRPGSGDRPARLPNEPRFSDRAPRTTDDGWSTAKPSAVAADVALLGDMVNAIMSGELPLTHSVLVARSGNLVVEEYFYGYKRDTMHDMRSASKSITSTLVGLAIDRKMIESSHAAVLPFFPEYRSYQFWSPAKVEIRIRDLLTMSSGLDANDSDRESAAAEGTYQSQTLQPDWIKLALDAPMTAEPGSRVIYGSANPLILGGILDNVVGERVEWFAEKNLFGPLGIERYSIYMDPMGVPYMGGGMHLLPRDMLKIAQMYLDGGRWQGRRILSASWIEESFDKYGRLEPLDRNGNEYGYLWWHETYEVNGESIDSIEARGNGGQYIFVVPELDVVAVITSGNYRGGLAMTRQPQSIFEQYVLPALLQQE